MHQSDLKLIESLVSSEIKPVITNQFSHNLDFDNQVRFRRDTESKNLEDLFYSVTDKLDDIETIFKETESTYNFLVEKEGEIGSKLTSLELEFDEK